MRHFISWAKALALAAATVFLTSCASGAVDKPERTVRIMLRGCEGVSIDGKDTVDIKPGETVTFKVFVDEGYVYIGNTAEADYDPESGRLRLSDNYAPKTVDMIVAKEDDVISLSLRTNNPSAEAGADTLLFAEPGMADIYASAPDYLSFDGWSEGGFLDDGGRLVSKSLSDRLYISESKTLYANFSGFSEYKIVYNLNGGHTQDGDAEYTAFGSFKEIFAMQQTLESNGSFIREGYCAVGYSTEPADYEDYASANDIPGFSNMGGVCSVMGDSLSLSVVWAKETPSADFTYEKKTVGVITDVSPGSLSQSKKNTEGIEITGYNGSDALVVIPEHIDGLPVLSIAANAFSGQLERVVIPKSVVNIEKNAFSDCEKLREAVLFDSVATVYDESFNKNLKTVVLNAQRLPVYSGAVEGSFCVKYERLRMSKGKKIVVVSGSSSLNGLNSELFEELMPGYTVINYGTNAANPSLFFLDVISKYTSEGDIVVHAPEYSSGGSMGTNKFHAKVFRGCEQCYDIFRDVDLSLYSGFWDCFRKFQIGDRSDGSLVPALHQQGKEYQLDTDLNKYGDISVSRPSVRGSFGGASETFDNFCLNPQNLNYINQQYEKTGALLLMSFGTFDKARLRPSAATQEQFDMFTEKCADALDYPVISNIGTYIMEHERFYDSEWHPNEEGAKIRTQNLVNDIKAYLSNPENY